MKRPLLLAVAALVGFAPASFAQGTDACTNPTPISSDGPFAFNNAAATNTVLGATCGNPGRDLFWVWTSNTTGSVAITLCNGTSGWDSVVAVYAGNTCPAGASIACNDDSCNLISRAEFNAVAGQQYVVRIGSYSSGIGGPGSFSFGPGGGSGGGCPTPSVGPDVIVGDVSDVGNYATAGGLDAIALGTTSCNVGSANLSWVSSTPNHPVIGGNLYRYSRVDGAWRFEQIGQSWLKHGFAALQGDVCCTCSGSGNGQALGVGCSDPYSSGLNGSQGGLGPRWQVNASTGAFTYPPANPTWSGSTARRIEVLLSDLAPSGVGEHPPRYIGECQYVTPDDAAAGNQNNNASWREMTATELGGNYTFAMLGGTNRQQSAVQGWAQIDNQVQLGNVQVAGDGLFTIASRVYELGGGQYRYEYAVYNMNSHRSGGAFSVPVPVGVNVTNAGFHDVVYRNGDGPGNTNVSGLDWAFALNAGVATWSSETEAQNMAANALRWGTTYNFRFDCNVAPVPGSATIGLWRAGSPNSVDGAAQVPGPFGGSASVCSGDGVGTACPCGNNGVAGTGCLNSLGTSGVLTATGTASVSNDTLLLSGNGMPDAACLYFQGTQLANGGAGTVFGDGLRCAAGTVTRLGTKTNGQGSSGYPLGGDLSVSVQGSCTPGATRIYQIWYRNAAAFCTASTFNLSNGWQITWQS